MIAHPTAPDYRSIGVEELLARRDALAFDLADVGTLHGPDSGPVAALLIGEHLAAAEAELARRVRLRAAGAAVPDPSAARYEAWRAVAAEVRERADILAVFADGGYHLRRTGRTEWHGQCFVCGGGVDRLMVRTDPPPRFWCRRCGLGGDAIAAHRTLTGAGFFDAVRHLAAMARVATPSATGHPARPVRREGVIRVA